MARVKPILVLAGIGAGAYVLIKILPGLKAAAGAIASGAQAVGNAIATPIADLINWATLGSPVAPSGTIVLHDASGQAVATINAASVAMTFDDALNAATFVYGNTIYYIVPNPSGGPAYDMNGAYHATPVPPIPAIATLQ